MWIIKPGFAATSTSACSCGLGMFAYVKRYVPEAIIVLQTATFCNRIRGYISCPQFSFHSLQHFSSVCFLALQSVSSVSLHFFAVSLSLVSVTLSLLILVLFLFNQLFSSFSVKSSYVSCLCLKCLIASSSLILVSTTVCHYYVIILLVISIRRQIHRLVGKTPLVIFIYYF